MTTQYWLVKSEPDSYSWADLVRDGRTDWTGVRNFAARNQLKAMQPGDRVFFYESVTGKAVIGIAEVSKAAFPDPTSQEEWVAVELKPVEPLGRPVTLTEIKKDPALANMTLLRVSRLSVQPVTEAEYRRIVELGNKQ